MALARGAVLILVVAFVLVSPALADAWWEREVCSEPSGLAMAGRDEARSVKLDDLFRELDGVADTYADFAVPLEGPLPPPIPAEELGPNCTWVQFEGYFRIVSYHDYRGILTEDAASFYLEGSPIGKRLPHFWVANWADNEQRWDFQARRVVVSGRVYDECLAILQFDRREGERGLRFGGPCHYGESAGMILTDVRIVEILDALPDIARDKTLSDVLDGETYDDAVRLMPPSWLRPQDFLVPASSLPDVVIERARTVLNANQGGRDAFLAELFPEPRPAWTRGRFDELAERWAGRESRFAARRRDLRFMGYDFAEAEAVVFETRMQQAEPPPWPIYHVCFSLDGSNQWPIVDNDARWIVSPFVCQTVQLDREGKPIR
ncbi:MAG: hypothetical protein HRU11_14660 [Parvularculaceae bacterium]|nr:hypothetical protein [Parvularculaceae bacterium]